MVPPVPVVAVVLLLASSVAVGVVRPALRVAVGALLPASEVAVGVLLLALQVAAGALLPLVTPPVLPALTANLPDCWHLPPRPTGQNHPGRGYQQRNSPAQVPNPILPTSQLSPAPAVPPRRRGASLLLARRTTGGSDTAPCRVLAFDPQEQRRLAASRRLLPVARFEQMLGFQLVPLVPLVDSDPTEPALDTDVPLVRTDWLLGQEETSSSKFARGEHPRTLPVGERRSPYLLRAPALVLGIPRRRANGRWPKPLWHLNATSL